MKSLIESVQLALQRRRNALLLLAVLAWSSVAGWAATVVPLPGHPERPASTNFALSVGSKAIEVKAERFGFDVGMFTMSSEPVTVQVTVSNAFNSWSLKPARHNLAATRTGNRIQFVLHQPLKLVLQVEGMAPLAILATPLETNVPNAGDANVLYFGPGTHSPGVIRPVNNQTVYLAPGALVKGRIEALNVTNVVVKGRGFLETEGYSDRVKNKRCGICFSHASNITVEGISLRSWHSWWQSLYLNSRNISVSHFNAFGMGVNTDGVDIDGVKNFVVSDSFLRSEDDALGWHALDAKANGQTIVENATAKDVVIWNTGAGNGMRMVGASMEDTMWRNITIQDVDILKYAGAGICSDHSDWAWVEDLKFENVSICRGRNAILMKIEKNRYSNDNGFLDERGHFNRLVFDHVQMDGGTITLKGFDAKHLIDNVYFNDCTNRGLAVNVLTNLSLNAFVTNVRFNQAPPPPPAPVAGVYEAEYTDTTTGHVPQYIFADSHLSNEKGKIIKMTKTDDAVIFLVNVTAPGTYAVKVNVKKGYDSGIVQLSVDGRNCGEPQDLYAASTQYQLLDFGRVTFDTTGLQPLKFTAVGRNAASAGYIFKPDYLQLLSGTK